MNAKLTLKLDSGIIEGAKEYALKKNISLSKMVERYFQTLVEPKQQTNAKYSPLVQELSGIINIDNDATLKEDHTNYLIEKYK